MFTRARKVGAALLGAILVGMASAQSTPSYDFSTLADQVTVDVTNAFTTALPVMIAVTALLVAWRYGKGVFRSV